MKRVITIFLLFCTLSAQASAVLWNDEGFSLGGGVDQEEEKGYWYITLDLLMQEDVYNDFNIIIEKNGNEPLRLLYSNCIDVAREAWFIVAEEGDEINAETTKDPSRVFLTNSGALRFEDRIKPEYNGNEPWTMYLGFETRHGYLVDPYPIYGWIELFVDNYTISLGNTCLDLTGRPVVVGVRSAEPVPEPASGALALLGATLLFRRRRGKGKCRPSRSDLRLIAARALPPASSRR